LTSSGGGGGGGFARESVWKTARTDVSRSEISKGNVFGGRKEGKPEKSGGVEGSAVFMGSSPLRNFRNFF